MSFPIPLIVSTALGLLLMTLPTWFGLSIKSTAADIAHIGGALIVTVAVISMGEVVRTGRFLNVLVGLVIAIAPWLVESGGTSYAVLSSILGCGVIGLSLPRGPITQSYGNWDRYIR